MFPATAILLGSGCAAADSSKPALAPAVVQQEYVEAERIPATAVIPMPAPPAADSSQPFRDGFIRVVGAGVEVLDAARNVLAANGGILRAPDESERCPASGFGRIVVKGNYFTIEQQTCGGMFFINEYVTFKAAADGKIYLHRFSIVKTNRDDPEEAIPQRDLSSTEFGRLELKDVALQRLYELL